MKRIIWVLDKEEMCDNLSIRSVMLEKHSANVFHTNTYHVVYEYSDTHRFIGDQFYREENLPVEERKFYEESL